MKIFLVYESNQYEGLTELHKVFDSRNKAEKFIKDKLAFIAKNRPKRDSIDRWHKTLVTNRIKEITGIPVPFNILNDENEYRKYIVNVEYNVFSDIENECVKPFTTKEREIFEYNFDVEKLEIIEMELE